MFKSRILFSKIMLYFNTAFSIIWLSNLAYTDAYISVYVIIAFASFFCLLFNQKSCFDCPISHRWILYFVSGLFSVLTLAANYPIFTQIRNPETIQASTNLLVNILNTGFSLVGGFCVAIQILKYIYCKIQQAEPVSVRSHTSREYRYLTLFSFLIVVFINLVHLLLVEYPGNLTEDTFTQISEMLSGRYSNFNTFWHTIIFQSVLKIGYAVFGEVNAAVAFYCAVQSIVVAAAFAYCIATLYLAGVPKHYLAVVIALYALIPYNIALSITVWKDVLFSAGCLFMTASFFRILRGLGSKPVLNYVVFIFGSLLFTLARNNGWYIYLVTCFVLAAPLRKYWKFVFTMFAVFLFCWLLNNPALNLLGVEGGDYTESLSIPLQQVSRVIVDGKDLTEDEIELISRVLDIEEVPELYTEWLSDPIKIEFRDHDLSYFEENTDDYIKLWIRLGMKHPDSYFKAWVEQTKGYWNAGYPYGMYSETVTENPYGVAKSAGGNLIATLFRLYFGLSRHVIFFEPLHSIGLHVWLVGLCALFNLLFRREEWLLTVPLLTLVLGLCLGTPVYASFRYVYPVFVCLPLVAGVTVYRIKE